MSQYFFGAVYMTQVPLQDSVNSHTVSICTVMLLYNIWCERHASGIFGATTQLSMYKIIVQQLHKLQLLQLQLLQLKLLQ